MLLDPANRHQTHGAGVGNPWLINENLPDRLPLDTSGQRRHSWLTRWTGQFSQLRASGRTSRLIPSFTREPSLTHSTLPLPISTSTVRFVLLCSLWYMSSAMSSNTGKAILNQFRYPVTLTFVQFGFVAGYCLLFMSPVIRVTRLRSPTRAIMWNTAPMAVFQVGGHIFSSVAIARIPVSTVHTIKALSPLFTVAAYALLFRVRYSMKTYVSLLPLTLGVMLACSADVSASNFIGILSAFGSALVFVSSNIVFKKIMPSPSGGSTASSHKLDKLNLLFYSSGLAFLLMIPVWIYSDLSALRSPMVSHPPHASSHGVAYYFFWNGAVHFGQNLIAFAILSTTSPVTYSIASLIKRIAVIIIAIAWFNQTVYPIQACGIALTSAGLWLYNSAKDDVEKGEKKMLRVEAERQMMLPTADWDRRIMDPTPSPRISRKMEETVTGSRSLTISTSVSHNHTYVSPTMASHPPLAAPRHDPHSSLHIHQGIPMYSYQPSSKASPTGSYPSPPPSLDSPSNDITFHASIRPQTVAQVT
ncbi:TPT-domain-containing protein [Ramaria rubella]|nr:TPT-domain-containing protein [Ramaria rubella]